MLTLTKGQTQSITYTATELAVLVNPFFLFVCTNNVTENIVKFVATNISTSPRYDRSTIVVNNHFANENAGLWSYQIFEQASSTNTNQTGLNMVEEGYLQLLQTVDPDVVYNGQVNTFKTYSSE
jgi:hypothetical protein